MNLETKRDNNKKEKAKRRWQRKINLTQAIAPSDTPSSLNASACYFPLFAIASTSNVGSASTSNAPSSFVTSDHFWLLFWFVFCFLVLVVVFYVLFVVVFRLLLLVMVLHLLFLVIFHFL